MEKGKTDGDGGAGTDKNGGMEENGLQGSGKITLGSVAAPSVSRFGMAVRGIFVLVAVGSMIAAIILIPPRQNIKDVEKILHYIFIGFSVGLGELFLLFVSLVIIGKISVETLSQYKNHLTAILGTGVVLLPVLMIIADADRSSARNAFEIDLTSLNCMNANARGYSNRDDVEDHFFDLAAGASVKLLVITEDWSQVEYEATGEANKTPEKFTGWVLTNLIGNCPDTATGTAAVAISVTDSDSAVDADSNSDSGGSTDSAVDVHSDSESDSDGDAFND